MMKDLYDCGFNTSGLPEYKTSSTSETIDWQVLLQPVSIQRRRSRRKKRTKRSVHLWHLSDPKTGRLSMQLCPCDPTLLFPKLKVWSEAIKKIGVLPYINLSECAVWNNSGRMITWNISTSMSIFAIPYISYDNYSLFEGGRLDEDRFYRNLELIRLRSLQADIPFWNVILSNAHFNYAEPSDATLAIQVYSTLAYGGKGIGYFTYYTPQVGNYRLAPIDRFATTKTRNDAKHQPPNTFSCSSVQGVEKHQCISYRQHPAI